MTHMMVTGGLQFDDRYVRKIHFDDLTDAVVKGGVISYTDVYSDNVFASQFSNYGPAADIDDQTHKPPMHSDSQHKPQNDTEA